MCSALILCACARFAALARGFVAPECHHTNDTSVKCLINREKNLRMRYLIEFEPEIPECFGE